MSLQSKSPILLRRQLPYQSIHDPLPITLSKFLWLLPMKIQVLQPFHIPRRHAVLCPTLGAKFLFVEELDLLSMRWERFARETIAHLGGTSFSDSAHVVVVEFG